MKKFALILMVMATASVASAGLISPGTAVTYNWGGQYYGNGPLHTTTDYWDLTQGDIKVSYSMDFSTAPTHGYNTYLNVEMISNPTLINDVNNPGNYAGEMIRSRVQQTFANYSTVEKYLQNNVHGNFPAPSPARPGDNSFWQNKWSFSDRGDTMDPAQAFDAGITDPGNSADGIYGTYNGTTWYNANADTTAANWQESMGTTYDIEVYLHYNDAGVDGDKDANYAADQRAGGTYYDLATNAKVPNVAYMKVNGTWLQDSMGRRLGFDFHTGSDFLTPQLLAGADMDISPIISDVTVEQAVPEPATMALLGLGGVAALIRRRK